MLDNLLNQKEYGPEAKAMTSEFFVNVYSYMFIALGISGTIAYMCGTKEFFIEYFVNESGTGLSPLFYVVLFAPLALGWAMGKYYSRFSISSLFLLFGLYSVLIGLGLSTIFLRYDLGSIFSTFVVTAGAFGTMAIVGYTTKTDLTKMGSLLYMVFFGMLIATIFNVFFPNGMVSYVVSLLGVVVFTGLTAYHMQNLKYIGEDPSISHMDKRKLSLIGGLTLYILFINLFLSLLRLMGGSRD